MFDPFEPDPPDHLATMSEACKEFACNAGMDNPGDAWILTPWDSWERNPFYSGPPVRHPEDDSDDEPQAQATLDYIADEIPF